MNVPTGRKVCESHGDWRQDKTLRTRVEVQYPQYPRHQSREAASLDIAPKQIASLRQKILVRAPLIDEDRIPVVWRMPRGLRCF
jgi:hypothetical protein